MDYTMFKALNLTHKLARKAKTVLRDRKGASELIAVVGLIIIVIVLLCVLFAPQITDWFNDLVMPGLKTATDNLFTFSA
ncbi:MAG TPA: hypothetical protein DEB10_07510 [Ruminococcaceae bacterium]|nr:hypothetical protein [Oscillospiraceae bacterium]HCA31162.1 hypothetical protein [Oscillospiraceae bacterium]